MKTLAAVFTALALTSTVCYAQSNPGMDIEAAGRKAWQSLLPALDADKDGKISAAEFEKIDKSPERAQAKFKQMDSDKDGFVTEAEYVEWVKAAAQGKRRQ